MNKNYKLKSKKMMKRKIESPLKTILIILLLTLAFIFLAQSCYVLEQYELNDSNGLRLKEQYIIKSILSASAGGVFSPAVCMYELNNGEQWVSDCSHEIGDKILK